MSKTSLDFSALINECRTNDRSRLIYNASEDHAILLFKALFDEAIVDKELPEINIASGELRTDFYTQLIEDAKKAMDNGITIKLAVLNTCDDLAGHPFAQLLHAHKNGEVYETIDEKVQSPHLIIVGNDRFRLETDHKQAKAVACFENKRIGSILKIGFEEIINDPTKMRRMAAA